MVNSIKHSIARNQFSDFITHCEKTIGIISNEKREAVSELLEKEGGIITSMETALENADNPKEFMNIYMSKTLEFLYRFASIMDPESQDIESSLEGEFIKIYTSFDTILSNHPRLGNLTHEDKTQMIQQARNIALSRISTQ